MRRVTVRWSDGYLEVFNDVREWRAGSDLLWIRFMSWHTRHIPLREVRWFEPEPNDMRDIQETYFLSGEGEQDSPCGSEPDLRKVPRQRIEPEKMNVPSHRSEPSPRKAP